MPVARDFFGLSTGIVDVTGAASSSSVEALAGSGLTGPASDTNMVGVDGATRFRSLFKIRGEDDDFPRGPTATKSRGGTDRSSFCFVCGIRKAR